MTETTKNYVIGAVAVLTVINTILIFTMDRGGRVIETPSANTALVAPSASHQGEMQQDARLQEYNAQGANAVAAGPTTVISFSEMEHDFGTVKQDTKNTHIFKFKNAGGEPLIIQDARGSCGCTVPKFPKEPIAPGAVSEIEVEYSPGKQEGSQMKTVTITANTDPNQVVLQIKANVEKV